MYGILELLKNLSEEISLLLRINKYQEISLNKLPSEKGNVSLQFIENKKNTIGCKIYTKFLFTVSLIFN